MRCRGGTGFWKGNPTHAWAPAQYGARPETSRAETLLKIQIYRSPPTGSHPKRRYPAAPCLLPWSGRSAWHFLVSRPGSAAQVSSGSSASPAREKQGTPASETASASTASTAPAPASAARGLWVQPAKAASEANTAATAIKVLSTPGPHRHLP